MDILSFFNDNNILSMRGFLGLFLQLSALFVGLRALIPKKVVSLEQGRPLFIVNFDKAEEGSFYGKCGVLSTFREFLQGQEDSDRIFIGYHSIVGNPKINEGLGEWGSFGTEPTPVVYAPQGGKHPQERWKSEWAAWRNRLGCPTDEGQEFLRPPHKEDRISPVLWAFRNRYDYNPEVTWPGRDTKIYSPIPFDDDQTTAANLCEHFEARSKNDKEKACAVIGLSQASKTINIFRLKNITHSDLSNVHIHIGTKAFKSGRVVEKAAIVEGFEIIVNTHAYAHVIAKHLPAEASRYLIIESNGRPLDITDLKVEAGLTTKFGPVTLRRIAIFAFIVTMALAIVAYCDKSTANNTPQPTPKSGAALGWRAGH